MLFLVVAKLTGKILNKDFMKINCGLIDSEFVKTRHEHVGKYFEFGRRV